jgi:GR25 family glycosyltransferase involved in LPS biosynthesis
MLEAQLNHLGLQVHFWDAITPDSFRRRTFKTDIEFWPGVLETYLSHLIVFEDIAQEGFRNALILEDDVDIDRFIVDR